MIKFLSSRLKAALKWEKFVPLAEWSENNIVLLTGAIKGRLQLKYTPHIRAIFEDIDKTEVNIVTIKSASQIGKSLIGMTFLMKQIATDANDMMVMLPTGGDELVRYIKKKWQPYVNGCQAAKDRIIDYGTLEKIRLKATEVQYLGGSLSFVGSSKPKTISVKYALFDEVAEFKRGSVGEALERMKTFMRFGAKAVLVSTMENENDEISHYYDTSEVKKQFWLHCGHCDGHFYPDETHLRFTSEKEFCELMGYEALDETTKYREYLPYAKREPWLECPCCGGKITQEMRDDSILGGKCKMVQVIKEFSESADGLKGVKWVADPEPKEKYSSVGYDINTLPMYFVPLSEFVEKTIKAGDNPTELEKFYIGYYNKSYRTSHKEKVSKNDILLLGNQLEAGIVPERTAKLYLTIDTQKDGFWYKVTAFQYGLTPNTVEYGFVREFNDLENLMQKRWKNADGGERMVDKVAIDRMGILERTAEVDAWVEHLVVNLGMKDFIYPTMGVQKDTAGRLWWETTLTKDVTAGSRKTTPIIAIKVNNTLLKNELANMLDRSIAKAKGVEEAQKYTGRLFFVNQDIILGAEAKIANGIKSISTDYERQMTSEEYVYKVDSKTGAVAKERTWEKKYSSIDNHLWDCSVLALALANRDNIGSMTEPRKENFKQVLKDFLPD